MASVGVKLFVLYLIMGVGVSLAARWAPVIERGGLSPIPFFYVMGGSLVFLFLTGTHPLGRRTQRRVRHRDCTCVSLIRWWVMAS